MFSGEPLGSKQLCEPSSGKPLVIHLIHTHVNHVGTMATRTRLLVQAGVDQVGLALLDRTLLGVCLIERPS